MSSLKYILRAGLAGIELVKDLELERPVSSSVAQKQNLIHVYSGGGGTVTKLVEFDYSLVEFGSSQVRKLVEFGSSQVNSVELV